MSRRRSFSLAVCAAVALAAALGTATVSTRAAGPHVLRVGRFHGIPGTYATIQAAVNAARPGDWVLVAPGDYNETGAPGAGILVTTSGIHIRGLSRNAVVIDGTLAGGRACAATRKAQNPSPTGRNGIEVLGVDGVSIENLTVCNFLSDASGNGGNEIWWNGGDGSGAIGLGSFHGAYLTASSSYFSASDARMGMYGVFVSNSDGPGTIDHAYASNMADSAYYIGACRDCNAKLLFVHAENSALGYSGSNSGGHLRIEFSEWDGNRAGIVPNSLANDDPPSPQDGSCPADPARSCTIIEGNWVHNNNNTNTPAVGLTAGAPVGTGIEISGGRNDTVRGNLVTNQGAWGILVHDYPDPSPPSVPTYCEGGLPGVPFPPLGTVCYFVGFGNAVSGNLLVGNGSFGNPTNGDLGDSTIPNPLGPDGNCFRGNVDPGPARLTSDPAHIQRPSILGTCGNANAGDTGELLSQIFCAALNVCLTGGTYPQPTGVRMLPIPRHEQTMPDPCEGVPDNPWCRG
jgi:hypothetical protein